MDHLSDLKMIILSLWVRSLWLGTSTRECDIEVLVLCGFMFKNWVGGIMWLFVTYEPFGFHGRHISALFFWFYARKLGLGNDVAFCYRQAFWISWEI